MANISGAWAGAAQYKGEVGHVDITVIFNQVGSKVDSEASQLVVRFPNMPAYILNTNWDGNLEGNMFEATQTNELEQEFTYLGFVDGDTIRGTWTSHTLVEGRSIYPGGTFILERKQNTISAPAEKAPEALPI